MNKPSMFPRMSYCIDGGRLLRASVFGVRSIYVCMYRNHRRRRGQIERGMPRAHARGLKSIYSIGPGMREGSEGPGAGAFRQHGGASGAMDRLTVGCMTMAARRLRQLRRAVTFITSPVAKPPRPSSYASGRCRRARTPRYTGRGWNEFRCLIAFTSPAWWAPVFCHARVFFDKDQKSCSSSRRRRRVARVSHTIRQ